MTIIHKYISREIFRYFGIVLTVVISIYVVVDFLEKIDDFLEAGLPLSKAISFFLFKIPFIIAQITPIGLLIAVLIVFGLMNKNNEIVALKSSGASIYNLLKPVLLIGLLLSIFLFFLSEIVVPITTAKANRIWLGEVRKESVVASKEKNIWIKDGSLIAHIKYYDPSSKIMYGITLNRFDENFRLLKRVDAKRGIFELGRWVLNDVIEQHLNEADGSYSVAFQNRRVETLNFLPDDLKRVAKKSEEMSFTELLAYIKKIKAEGYGVTPYRIDLYAKIAFPLVCIIMCMVGTGIALRGRIKDGLPVSIAYGLGTAFLYWVFYSFCMSLGYGEMLPPLIAAWAADFIFLCFGVLLLLNAE